jgi:5-(carboxyamino)imidazole ribonucleotide synthase
MINILGPKGWEGKYRVDGLQDFSAIPSSKLYIYGKSSSKPQRKLGHITATGKTAQEALIRARRARNAIRIALSEEAQK